MNTSRVPVRRFQVAGSVGMLAIVLGWTVCNEPLQADVILLKDGYAIHGKLIDEKTVIFDPATGEGITVKKANGFTTVDDGARYTIFSTHYTRVGDVNTFDKFQDHVQLLRTGFRISADRLPTLMAFDRATDFGADWRRTLYYKSTGPIPGTYAIKQQVVALTPHFTRLDSVNYNWSSFYLTRELGPERVLKLLYTHPDLMEKKDMPDAAKRTRIIRFLIQADWLKEAEAEIKRLEDDFPQDKKAAEEFRNTIRLVRLERQVAEIERARDSGRHSYALNLLKGIPKEELPAKLTVPVLTLQTEYEAKIKKYEDSRRFLAELKGDLKGPGLALSPGIDFILEELNLDSVSRLDTFLALAAQLERDRKAGKKPIHETDQVVAAAISGWLQGANSAQTKVDFAQKLLAAREMALTYLRTDATSKRGEILGNYERDPNALPYDELEKLISLLPPPLAPKQLPSAAVECKTEILPETGNTVTYVLQLPPEYQHSRPYPLLVVLPTGNQRPQDMLQALGEFPTRNGYIVAVMDWPAGFQSTYGYTVDEHNALKGLIRHLRRTYQVDSDRVFLFGFGEGATMAMDIASAHPDMFAGVVPMGPNPSWSFLVIGEYWKNFQNLPVYLVTGDRSGDAVKTVRRIYGEWMRLGYPALAVAYKGRGNEFFAEELPFIFDWMGRKTRVHPVPGVGKLGEQFHTMRPSDNRFYWIGIDQLFRDRQWSPTGKGVMPKFGSARVSARIIEGNQIVALPLGMNQMTIWLGREMIDFAKPILVKVDQKEVMRKTLTPKISVLLEDLYERGDRQRPYLQRIDLSNLTRFIKATTP